jgi:hypothetical protein
VLGLVLPNKSFEIPTIKFSNSNESIERFIGRHDLNLRLIKIAVTSKKKPVNPETELDAE